MRAWSTAPVTPGASQFAQFNRTGTSRTRTNDGKSRYDGLQMKVDRRFRNGLMVTNTYTLSRSSDYVNENTTIGTPIDFGLSWGRSNFDRTHNYVLSAIYELPWGPGKRWMNRLHDGQDHRRLAGERSVRRAVGDAADDHRQRRAAQHARQHRVRQPQRRTQGARRPRPRPAVLRSDGVLAAAGGAAGQPAPEQRSRGARLLAARSGAVQAVPDRLDSATPSSGIDAFNAPDATRWGNPNTGFSTATGNTFGQITGLAGQTTQRVIRFGGRFAF